MTGKAIPWLVACALVSTAQAFAQQPELTGTVGFEVGSRSGIVRTLAVTVGDGGTGPYKAILAGDPLLPTHTLYRPRDLGPFSAANRLPIVAWANGGCRSTSGEFRNFLSEVASHGFLIVAIGPAAHSAVMGSEAPTNTSDSPALLEGVTWAIAENAREGSPYYQKLDPTKVAVMGQSCGGVQALDVSIDPRVTTTVVWNSGVFGARAGGPPRGGAAAPPAPAGPAAPAAPAAAGARGAAPGGRGAAPAPAGAMARMTRERLRELHGPVAYFAGGSSDIAFEPSGQDFDAITHVPVLRANQDVGHYPATYRQPNGGAFAVAGTAWLKWQLKGDRVAARMFVGDQCGLCTDRTWTVQRKNIQ